MDGAVDGALVGAFAIDGHGGGDDEFLKAIADGMVVGDDVEEDGCAAGVDVYVAFDLVHRLSDADHGGLVVDDLYVAQGLLQIVTVADVALDVLSMGVAVAGPLIVFAQGAVDLGFEVIEYANVVSGLKQRVYDVGADEAGAAGYEDGLGHLASCGVRACAAVACGMVIIYGCRWLSLAIGY